METISVSIVECGLARCAAFGQRESGDHYLICNSKSGALIAVIDGIGHGTEAAHAAEAAASVLGARAEEPIISLVEQCHNRLRTTRGVVLSLASIDVTHCLMTWLGVGNVQGVLMRANSKKGNAAEILLLRGGVVGDQLPPLQATVLPVARGDTLYFVTDGIRTGFAESLTARENPQRAADRILERFQRGTDDALVLVARLTGIQQ